MQVARLTQEYYGFIRQPALSRRESGADKSEASRSRPSVLPTERVVEGELLRDRSARVGDPLDQILQRRCFSDSAANSQGESFSTQAAQRAINAYLDNAATPNASKNGGQSRAIDYYA